MNHKIHILFLIICLCFTFACPVNAADDTVILKAVDASGCVGGQFDVVVTIDNSNRIYAGSFNICFDNTSIELVDCVKGDVFGSISPNINKSYAPGKIRISWMAATSVDGGELLRLTFRGLTAGSTLIEFENVKFGTLYAESLLSRNTAGNVTVENGEGELKVSSLSASGNNVKIISYENCLRYEADIPNSEDSKVYAASYNESGKLVGVAYPVGVAFDVQIPEITKHSKIFCWNGVKPLAEDVGIDDEGAVYGLLKSGSNTVKADIINQSSEDKRVRVYVAQYGKNGEFIDESTTDYTIGAVTNTELAHEFSVSDSSSMVKIYVRDENNVSLIRNITLSR